MQSGKIHAVYFSPCGGTKKVAEALAPGFGSPVIFHNRTLPEMRKDDLGFGEDEFVIFTAPVYGGRIPRKPDNLFGGIRGNNTACALVAVYGNRAFEGALIDLYDLARLNGFVPVAGIAAIAEHSMAPVIATNRPDEEDRKTLAAFASKIMARYENGGEMATPPGAMPEWRIPEGVIMLPFTDRESCKNCGACSRVCPTAAIPPDQPWSVIEELCAHCAACIHACRHKARQMGNDKAHEMAREHLAVCMAGRREPELFF